MTAVRRLPKQSNLTTHFPWKGNGILIRVITISRENWFLAAGSLPLPASNRVSWHHTYVLYDTILVWYDIVCVVFTIEIQKNAPKRTTFEYTIIIIIFRTHVKCTYSGRRRRATGGVANFREALVNRTVLPAAGKVLSV